MRRVRMSLFFWNETVIGRSASFPGFAAKEGRGYLTNVFSAGSVVYERSARCLGSAPGLRCFGLPGFPTM